MSTMQTDDKKALKKFAFILLTIDLIWAVLFATLNATVLHIIGGAANVGEGATMLATVLTWCITFAIAFFQGGITLIVVTIIGFVLYSIFLGNKNGRSGGFPGIK